MFEGQDGLNLVFTKDRLVLRQLSFSKESDMLKLSLFTAENNELKVCSSLSASVLFWEDELRVLSCVPIF